MDKQRRNKILKQQEKREAETKKLVKKLLSNIDRIKELVKENEALAASNGWTFKLENIFTKSPEEGVVLWLSSNFCYDRDEEGGWIGYDND